MLSSKRRSTMNHVLGNRLSRRCLLSNAVASTSLAFVAPLLGKPARSMAQTPVMAKVTTPSTPAATPSPKATPATLDEVLQAGIDRGLPGVALRVERGNE